MSRQTALKTLSACAFAAFLAASPIKVAASETAWQEIAPQVRARLISSDFLTSDNMLQVGLEIEMPRGTKTYWRVPGDSGIPAQFDWQVSDSFIKAKTQWPFPERDIEASGTLSYVYHGDVVFPIHIEVAPGSSSVPLQLDLIMGICSDICVPVSVSFDHLAQLNKRDVLHATRLAVAQTDVPMAWPENRAAPIAKTMLADDGTSVEFALSGDTVSVENLIVEPMVEGWFIGMPVFDSVREIWSAELYGYGRSEKLTIADIRYVFQTSDGPYEYISP